MANRKSYIVKGTTLFCNTRKPIKKDAKFHGGKYMIQLITIPAYVPAEIQNCPQYKLITGEELANIIPEDVEFQFPPTDGTAYNGEFAEITVYSNYPFNFFDDANVKAVSDSLANLSIGKVVKVAYTVYQNKQGNQCNVAGVQMKELEQFEEYNPFE